MQKQIEQFFSDLGNRGHDPRLRRISGVVRFDIINGAERESCFVTVNAGDVAVTAEGPSPNAVLAATESVFAQLINRGEWFAAFLRGDLVTKGDYLLIDRLSIVIFPGPPDALGPRKWQERKRQCPTG
ncbi:SCP2 sterol-binding domain-containing protein [Micromonospora sp. NPDC048830]|uniref:SCP2 sterol-binding domain-containing protein n=1 Tax=Micromonospora sp. NPDC048830 TaxID=3364257 RepID=UPI003718F676